MKLFTELTRFAGFTGLSILHRFDVGALRATPVQCRGTGLFTELTRFAGFTGLSILHRFAVETRHATSLQCNSEDSRTGGSPSFPNEGKIAKRLQPYKRLTTTTPLGNGRVRKYNNTKRFTTFLVHLSNKI
jgi:hypothetical protein